MLEFVRWVYQWLAETMAEAKADSRDAQLASFLMEGEENPDGDTVRWMKVQFDAEIERLKGLGQRVVPLAVKNCSLAKEGKQIINRIELPTAFDFTKVRQILMSDPIDCSTKSGFKYVNVVLFTEKPLPLLVPYIYDAGYTNDLKHWIFINSRMERARHRVGHFTNV